MAGEGMATTKAAGAGIGGSSHHWPATRLGFVATTAAFGAALHCFPAAEEVSRGLDTAGAVLLLLFLLAVAGVNVITAGLRPTPAAAARILGLFLPAQSVLLRDATAFARRNAPVLAVSAASAAATGIVVAGAARPVLCFLCFALLLLAVSVATAGLASSTR